MRIVISVLVCLCFVAPAASMAAGPPTPGITDANDGAGLFAANCSSCHGPHGEGIAPPGRPGVGDLRGMGPSLLGVGARAADFYLRTGYMPLASATEQPWQSRVLFSSRQLKELVGYVASLGKGPGIPRTDPAQGSLSAGLALFTDNCAGCHQIAGEGGYVTGARVPPLTQASDTEIAEAVRIGPYVMPSFSPRSISNRQLDSIILYVDYAKHPDDAGGLSLGRLGPIPEGMVTWLIAASVLVGTCVILSRRRSR